MMMYEVANKMKDKIKMIYGEDSHEAGYLQWVFSKRDTMTFVDVYEDLMKKAREQGLENSVGKRPQLVV